MRSYERPWEEEPFIAMSQIDKIRLTEAEVTRLRELEARVLMGQWEVEERRALRFRRRTVEKMLRKWWAQGCKEPPR